MPTLTAGFLISELTLALLPIKSSLPVDPLPPTTDMDGYSFGAATRGKPGGTHKKPGAAHKRKAPRSKKGDSPEPSLPSALCSPWVLEGGAPLCVIPPSPTPGRRVSPAQLAASTWERLPIPAPAVRTAPPRGAQGLVSLPHWFWVTNGRPLSDRAEAGGVWVEVTARPQSLTIDPGNGQRAFRCRGTGTVYDPSRPAASQRTTCSHAYTQSSAGQPAGAYRVRVTVVWGGTWTGSGGTGGTLPLLSRSANFPLRIAEAQGLYERQ